MRKGGFGRKATARGLAENLRGSPKARLGRHQRVRQAPPKNLRALRAGRKRIQHPDPHAGPFQRRDDVFPAVPAFDGDPLPGKPSKSTFSFQSEPKSFRFASMVFYTILMSFQLVTYCWNGNEAIVHSVDVADAVFGCDWLITDEPTKRTLLLMMLRAQRPVKFTAAKFSVLSLQTYVWVSGRWSTSIRCESRSFPDPESLGYVFYVLETDKSLGWTNSHQFFTV